MIQGGGFDIPLNSSGRRQAEQAASCLSTLLPALDVVASSHLQRASETADIIHAKQNGSSQRVVNKGLGEMRFGTMEGAIIRGPSADPAVQQHVQRQHTAMRSNKYLKWEGPEGESIHDVETRARRALRDLCETHPAARYIAVVAHGRTNKILLQGILEMNEAESQQLVQGNTCINVLDRSANDEYTSRLINYTDHINDIEDGK